MADPSAHYFEPSQGHGLRHDPLTAIIAPRPIGWISTISADGIANLAPYSFFNAFNYYPPIVGFSSIGWKDTVANVAATREFCWNLSTRALAEPMNLSCAPAPPEIDEFDVAGVTRAPSRLVAPPRVLESPVNFECRLTEMIRLRDVQGAELETWMVFGEVVAVHIDQALIADGQYQTVAAHPLGRLGRLGDYVEVTEGATFEMRRPGWPIA
jgi:flavin reductase (DIM6/NTAB) family NADH-FMN oxidoreductase RutF